MGNKLSVFANPNVCTRSRLTGGVTCHPRALADYVSVGEFTPSVWHWAGLALFVGIAMKLHHKYGR